MKPRTENELITALQIALDSFTKEDITNWFKYHGYSENIYRNCYKQSEIEELLLALDKETFLVEMKHEKSEIEYKIY